MVCSIVVALLSACSTSKQDPADHRRARPSTPLSDCKALKTRIEGREHFFKTLRGEARISSGGESTELDLALMTPAYLRAEVTGPLGIRLGLIQINPDWVQFYDARKRKVHRLPFGEFTKDSVRRDRYLRVLPVSIPGPFFLDLALSRSGLIDGDNEISLRSCEYQTDENVYRVLYVARSEFEGRNRWHRVDIDPTSFFPLLHLTRLTPKTELLDDKAVSWTIPEWKLVYSDIAGEGFSTLPRKLQVFQRDQLLWSFEWISAEPIEDRGPEIFQWRPGASISVQDY
ncbi:MAG: hypothetical protein ABIR96_06410 [Bdellovibrionota bacterium]